MISFKEEVEGIFYLFTVMTFTLLVKDNISFVFIPHQSSKMSKYYTSLPLIIIINFWGKESGTIKHKQYGMQRKMHLLVFLEWLRASDFSFTSSERLFANTSSSCNLLTDCLNAVINNNNGDIIALNKIMFRLLECIESTLTAKLIQSTIMRVNNTKTCHQWTEKKLLSEQARIICSGAGFEDGKRYN